MIDKFNLYDLFGYLIPGVFSLVLLWLPIQLMWGYSFELSIGAGVAAAAVAYLVGHVLQALARPAVNNSVHGFNWTYILLHETDDHFPSETKAQIRAALLKHFDLDVDHRKVSMEGMSLDEQRAVLRDLNRKTKNAGRLARSMLVHVGKSSHHEQFEGMYALSRGMSATAGAAAIYYLGWFITLSFGYADLTLGWTPALILLGAGLAFLASLTFLAMWALRREIHATTNEYRFLLPTGDPRSSAPHTPKDDYRRAWTVAAAVLAGAFLLGLLGGTMTHDLADDLTLLPVVLLPIGVTMSAVVCVVGYRSFRHFAKHFVSNVLRNFLMHELTGG